jgi:hypothetical protein
VRLESFKTAILPSCRHRVATEKETQGTTRNDDKHVSLGFQGKMVLAGTSRYRQKCAFITMALKRSSVRFRLAPPNRFLIA